MLFGSWGFLKVQLISRLSFSSIKSTLHQCVRADDQDEKLTHNTGVRKPIPMKKHWTKPTLKTWWCFKVICLPFPSYSQVICYCSVQAAPLRTNCQSKLLLLPSLARGDFAPISHISCRLKWSLFLFSQLFPKKHLSSDSFFFCSWVFLFPSSKRWNKLVIRKVILWNA